jgi:hypothetical protein
MLQDGLDSSGGEISDEERMDIPVGRPRDIAEAQPTLNNIICIFTDVKGPFKTAGIKGEVYTQSYIEEKTKFLRRDYFSYKSQVADTLSLEFNIE